jgi:hypothetical protein
MSDTSTPSMTPTFSPTSTSILIELYTPKPTPSSPIQYTQNSSSELIIAPLIIIPMITLCIIYNIIFYYIEKKRKKERRERPIVVNPTIIQENPLYRIV